MNQRLSTYNHNAQKQENSLYTDGIVDVSGKLCSKSKVRTIPCLPRFAEVPKVLHQHDAWH